MYPETQRQLSDLVCYFFIWKRPDSNLNGETQISCTITEGEKTL